MCTTTVGWIAVAVLSSHYFLSFLVARLLTSGLRIGFAGFPCAFYFWSLFGSLLVLIAVQEVVTRHAPFVLTQVEDRRKNVLFGLVALSEGVLSLAQFERMFVLAHGNSEGGSCHGRGTQKIALKDGPERIRTGPVPNRRLRVPLTQ